MYVVVVEVYISFHGGALSTHLLLQCTQARAFAWQHLNHIKKGKKKRKNMNCHRLWRTEQYPFDFICLWPGTWMAIDLSVAPRVFYSPAKWTPL